MRRHARSRADYGVRSRAARRPNVWRLEAEIPEFTAPLRAAVGERGWSVTPVPLDR